MVAHIGNYPKWSSMLLVIAVAIADSWSRAREIDSLVDNVTRRVRQDTASALVAASERIKETLDTTEDAIVNRVTREITEALEDYTTEVTAEDES